MDHFPVFLRVHGRRIVLSGGGEAAVAKLRLLMKTTAHITVFAQTPVEVYWEQQNTPITGPAGGCACGRGRAKTYVSSGDPSAGEPSSS